MKAFIHLWHSKSLQTICGKCVRIMNPVLKPGGVGGGGGCGGGGVGGGGGGGEDKKSLSAPSVSKNVLKPLFKWSKISSPMIIIHCLLLLIIG